MIRKYILSFLVVVAVGIFIFYVYKDKGIHPYKHSQPVEEYIRTNISSLSPDKEVLGGVFYVVSLELSGEKGVVEYEDGHNLFVADFTYSISEGIVSINSFSVRR